MNCPSMINGVIPVIVLIVASATAYLGIPHVVKVFWRSKSSAAARQSGYKFLTFDDGPDSHSTPKILDTLDELGVKATFFVVGERAESNPAIIRSILSRGHQVGEHGYQHVHPWTSWPGRYVQELVRSNRAVRACVGPVARVVFRPPYGKLNLVTLVYVLLTRRQVTFWDIDPRDYESTDPQRVADDVLSHLDARSVVLLHDGRIGAGMSGSDLTVRALRLLIGQLSPDTRFRTIGALSEDR